MDLDELVVTGSDFALWKDHPITMALFEFILSQCAMIGSDLIKNAGKDSGNDRFNSGIIIGLSKVADWVPDTVEE